MNRQINYWTDSCNEKFHAPELDEDLSADLVVIGGGYTGCAAALEAANLGINVVLLEANIFWLWRLWAKCWVGQRRFMVAAGSGCTKAWQQHRFKAG